MIIFKSDIFREHKRRPPKGFTLVELLVVISIIAVLLGILMPALGSVRRQAKSIVCMSNIRQLSLAFVIYTDDYNGYAMPSVGSSGVYWWGKKIVSGVNAGIDHKQGFVWPYLKSELSASSVYQCPSQAFGSYNLQGKPPNQPDDPKWITSTYGYNGYYLSPPQSGWYGIRNQPWKKIANIKQPATVLAFADTLIDMDCTGKNPILINNFSIDPPYIYNSGKWNKNISPTTCFRHNEKTNVVFVDGHCKAMDTEGAKYASATAKTGSIGKSNAPYYVPDFLEW